MLCLYIGYARSREWERHVMFHCSDARRITCIHGLMAAIHAWMSSIRFDAVSSASYDRICLHGAALAAAEAVAHSRLVTDLFTHLSTNRRSFSHSTETAFLAVSRGDVAVLILLDLLAAFDTVDHEIELQRLQTVCHGINDVAHRWFMSYQLRRSQYVRNKNSRSCTIKLICSVPQGSVLGSVLFILYMEHRRPNFVDRKPWPDAAFVRRRHTGLCLASS